MSISMLNTAAEMGFEEAKELASQMLEEIVNEDIVDIEDGFRDF